MTSQEQFLDVLSRDEAERRFHAALRLEPLAPESIPLDAALGRVLSSDVVAEVDVPAFDRSNYDGFAVRAADTYGADERNPRQLNLLDESIPTGTVPRGELRAGWAMPIATGGMMPRGADAVVMVEHADVEGDTLRVAKAVAPGFGVAFAGTDIAAGELVLRRGELLTSRETGVLAAIGRNEVDVWRRPRVAIISTGDEIIAPGEASRPATVYDSNARILADAVRELGGQPLVLGIVADEREALLTRAREAVAAADVVLLSGGTSKGQGDLSYRIVEELGPPGVVAHGVALKPGKPICLAVCRETPVVILPGFPTSAIFTFHEFVAPVIRAYAGQPRTERGTATARMAVQVNSEIGRTEYLLVGLVDGAGYLSAYPMGKGSGSVTSFSRADGFVTIDRHREIVPADTLVSVQLLGPTLRVADLVVIGSHCVGLDYLLGRLQDQGLHTKFLAVGSTGGLSAAARGECDVAGVHLLDAESGEYNRPFLTPGLTLVSGYTRGQGVVFRRDDERFALGKAQTAQEVIERVKHDTECVMVNRNAGSGTRILIDELLAGTRPSGYAVQARSHNAVAAAVAQGRADWGVAVEWVARHNDLGFLPLREEHYDFVVPQSRIERPAVQAFLDQMTESSVRRRLHELGFVPSV